MNALTWLKAARSVINGNGSACPSCGATRIDFQYVGDETTRIGYVDVWCEECGKGVHVSRAKAPQDVELLPLNAPDDVIRNRIPAYSPVEFDEDEQSD